MNKYFKSKLIFLNQNAIKNCIKMVNFKLIFFILSSHFISFIEMYPQNINLINQQNNTYYENVKNMLFDQLEDLVEKEVELSLQKNYEFCNLTFINSIEKSKAEKDFVDIKIWLNGYKRKRRSVNLSSSFKHFSKYNNQDKNSVNNDKQRTIETAVFIDRFLASKFNNRLLELKKLVLAIMHQVQIIYSYNSLKTKIKIVIVKYEVLNLASNSPDPADGDIDKYLDNFCAWQAQKLRSIKLQPKWDHALMLTGLDLYKDLGNGKKNRKVLGLAWVNGMCKETYSCTLNEGKSFEASYVIAHEMGHSLGILHDGRGNNCDNDKYLMSEKTGPGKVNWSACSNYYIENFVFSGHAKCLENRAIPTPDLDFTKFNLLPGQLYNANLQCQLALGLQYSAYYSPKNPFEDICRELWCITGNWATPAHPALEGTQCSSNGICYQGQCKTTELIQQQSNRSIYNSQNSLVAVQRNYNPGNTSNKHEQLLQIDFQPSQAKPRLSNVKITTTSTTTTTAKKNPPPTTQVVTEIPTTLMTTILPTTENNPLIFNVTTDDIKEPLNSLMEEIRSFFKSVTSKAESLFNIFKFKVC